MTRNSQFDLPNPTRQPRGSSVARHAANWMRGSNDSSDEDAVAGPSAASLQPTGAVPTLTSQGSKQAAAGSRSVLRPRTPPSGFSPRPTKGYSSASSGGGSEAGASLESDVTRGHSNLIATHLMAQQAAAQGALLHVALPGRSTMLPEASVPFAHSSSQGLGASLAVLSASVAWTPASGVRAGIGAPSPSATSRGVAFRLAHLQRFSSSDEETPRDSRSDKVRSA